MTTYNQVIHELSPDVWVYQGLKSYVLTHKEIDNKEKIEFTSENVCDLIRRIKGEEGKDIWICGGANIANQLIKENLIDEYQLSIMPTILGSGIRLFNDKNELIKLHFVNSKAENGVIHCVYSKGNN